VHEKLKAGKKVKGTKILQSHYDRTVHSTYNQNIKQGLDHLFNSVIRKTVPYVSSNHKFITHTRVGNASIGHNLAEQYSVRPHVRLNGEFALKRSLWCSPLCRGCCIQNTFIQQHNNNSLHSLNYKIKSCYSSIPGMSSSSR
jgi:hypothetical protein